MITKHDNQWRRYGYHKGTIVVSRTNKNQTALIPVWCNHINTRITRREAARILRKWRKEDPKNRN